MTDYIWEAQDAHRLSEFLETPTGQKLKADFKATEPSLEETIASAARYTQWLKDKKFIETHMDIELYRAAKKQENPHIDTSALDVR